MLLEDVTKMHIGADTVKRLYHGSTLMWSYNMIDEDSAYFEGSAGIAGWDNSAYGDGGVAITASVQLYDGRNCIKFGAAHVGIRAIRWYILNDAEGNPLEIGETYRLTYKYRLNYGSQGLRVCCGGSLNAWYATQVIASGVLSPLATQWTDFDAGTFVAAAEYAFVMFDATWDKSTYFDDIMFTKE